MSLRSLDVYKALGDSTRYAIVQILNDAETPLTVSDIATLVSLHPNTLRPHLERLREVGLVDVTVDTPTGVGRPLHRYAITADTIESYSSSPEAISAEPALALFATMLARVARVADVSADEAETVARAHGRVDGYAYAHMPSCLEAVVQRLHGLGFEPDVADGAEADEAIISFTACPFRDLAEANPAVVCALHRGLVTGFVDALPDGEVTDFHSLEHRDPCRMTLISR
jgi:predicted ArsR family transcriptional regulator